jgi:hypothetical protein
LPQGVESTCDRIDPVSIFLNTMPIEEEREKKRKKKRKEEKE